LVIIGASLVGACGGAASEQAKTASPAPTEGGGAATGAQARLQGTWEIIRYESTEPIPDEAMPLMGELFDTLRLSVHGDKVTIDTSESSFKANDNPDGTFKLVTSSGMFDGANCRFTADDTFEVDDRGEHWPGKSVLKRAR
jgi:hypothetical protein